jgi:hypothetical protein
MRRALVILVFAPMFSIGCGGASDCAPLDESTESPAPEPEESGLCVEEVDRGAKPIE